MTKVWLDLATLSGEEGRGDRQYGWQIFFGNFFQECSILDVGAGLGRSRSRLMSGGNKVTLQDIGPDLPVDIVTDVSQIESKSYDVVTAFDVVEHIIDDTQFVTDLSRIARKFVAITTPNLLISNCKNQYHYREYTPIQFIKLFDVLKICLLMTGRNMVHRPHSMSSFMRHEDPSQAIVVTA